MAAVLLPTCVTSTVPQVPGLSLPSPEICEDVFGVGALGPNAAAKMPALPVSGAAPTVIDVNDFGSAAFGLGAELTGSGQGGEDWMTRCLDFGDLMRFTEVEPAAEVPSMFPADARCENAGAKRKPAADDYGQESADSLVLATSEDDAVAPISSAHAGGRKRTRVTAARSRDVMDKKMVRLDQRNAELKAAISETQGEIDQVVRLMRLIFERRRKARRKAKA